jgi:hypothetical protein
MRRLAVIHETQYRYGAMVEHAHHWVRLRPIQDATQQIRSFALAIDPMPRYRSERRDAHGVAEVRFDWYACQPRAAATTPNVSVLSNCDPSRRDTLRSRSSWRAPNAPGVSSLTGGRVPHARG